MLTIPLYLFLFLYLFFLAVFFSFLIVNIYHLVSGGSLTFASFFVTFLTLAGTAFALYGTWLLLEGVDWQSRLTLLRAGTLDGWFSL